MPVIGIATHALLEKLDSRLQPNELLKTLAELGCDIEDVTKVKRYRCLRCENILEVTSSEGEPILCDRCDTDFREHSDSINYVDEVEVIRMEALAVRPDMFEVGGLSRTVRGYIGLEKGAAQYPLTKSDQSVRVGKEMALETSYRPCIAVAVVKNITLDDDLIRIIMKLQENLHWALGRNRKHASIGVYDYDTVQFPLQYRGVGKDELKFVPLGSPDRSERYQMTPEQILQEHPKGKAYAFLLEGFSQYPLLEDAKGNVLSMPPIINSEDTKLQPHSKNLVIDVTGSNERIVMKTLNILTTSLLELCPEIVVETVDITYDDKTICSPDFTPQSLQVSTQETSKLIGIKLNQKEVMEYLERMRHTVTALDKDIIQVEVPAYRNDILHERDLIEDIAIAYGYHRIPPEIIPTMTIAESDPLTQLGEKLQLALCGLGFFETLNLMLTSEERNYERLGLAIPEDYTQIGNPISKDQTMVRTHLMPSLLETFSINTHNELPQHIFELGDVCVYNPKESTGASTYRHLAAGMLGPRVGFSHIKALLSALSREAGYTFILKEIEHPAFLTGRVAQLYRQGDGAEQEVGILGEIHPAVLERYGLFHPVAMMELRIAPIRS
jgi:phenylalanyl-tRNA synthetase beta chain